MQVHVSKVRAFKPVETTAALFTAVRATSRDDFAFRTDPYEYEREKPAIDILTGSADFRNMILEGADLSDFRKVWAEERKPFEERFKDLTHYPEDL